MNNKCRSIFNKYNKKQGNNRLIDQGELKY